jgi:hypothetical protein
MPQLVDALEFADKNKMCVQWGCTTCGARDFKKLIQDTLEIDTLLEKRAVIKIAEQLKLLKSIQYIDSIRFLIRICTSKMSEHDLIAIWDGSPCGDIYRDMLERKRKKDAARREHERRNDPEFVQQDRERKKNERAEAHEERLRLKAERDAIWREKQKNSRRRPSLHD